MTIDREKPRYRIKAASKKTGISPVTIRAWELRYQILSPSREQNGYRLYSEVDISMLRWLKFQVDSGVQISQAAIELKEMTDRGEKPELDQDSLLLPKQAFSTYPVKETVERLYHHLTNHDEVKASDLFSQAGAALPLLQLFEQVIIPILVRIGEDWYLGRIMITTEHFVSSFIRARLMLLLQTLPIKSRRPQIVIGGAPHDMHELGPLMMAILMREAGYVVEFIGPDIPLKDLADYAVQEKIHLIILSATTSESAKALEGFKDLLDRARHKPIFAYGGAAFSFQPELIETIPGIYLGKTLTQSLERIRELIQP